MSVKNKMIGTTAVVAVIAAGLMATGFEGINKDRFKPKPEPTRSPGDRRYVLSVSWRPASMHPAAPVHIRVLVDGIEVIFKKQRVSPWGETMTAEKGAAIRLEAVSSYWQTEHIDCIIMQDGKVPDTGFDSRDNAGRVMCQA